MFHTAALPYEGLSVFSHGNATSIVSGTIATAVAIHNKVRLFINCSSMADTETKLLPSQKICNRPVDPYGLAKVMQRTSKSFKRFTWIILFNSGSP